MNRVGPIVWIATLLAVTPGCAAVRGIFKAGLWAGVIGIVLLMLLVTAGIRAFRRG